MSILTEELESHCECFETAIANYDGEKDADSFIEWYMETYVYHAEIIYYHNAMEFLMEHDPSLRDSMAKAAEYGYTPNNLNSELLASLLLQDILQQELESCRDDIAEYFEEKESNDA